jgi:hypothetical protein
MTDQIEKDFSGVSRKMLSPSRIALQLVGFLVGLVLLYFCLSKAIGKADWTLVRDAHPWLLVSLVFFGLLSTVLDGFVFWGVLKPYRALKPLQVQGVNMSAAFLNYAPVRLGTVFRISYHAKVDRVGVVPILGWFVAITITTMACMASISAATLITGAVGLGFPILIALFLLLSGIILWALARVPALQRIAAGKEKMIGDPRALATGLLGRLLVLSSNCARMGTAAVILNLSLGTRDVILLSVVGLLASFNPLGRVGWREWTLALLTPYLAAKSLGGGDTEAIEAVASQLVLIESAGEAIAIIPLGLFTLIWAMRRLLKSSPTMSDESTETIVDP